MSEERMLEMEEWQDRMERVRARHDFDMGRRSDPPGPGPRKPRIEPTVAQIEAERKAREEWWREKRLDDAFAYGSLARDAVRHNDAGMARMWARTAAQFARLAGVGKGDGDE